MRVVLAGLLVVLIAGCGDQVPQRASDCSQAIRTEDVVYAEAGFVTGAARRQGQAERASCDDNGEAARGAYFPRDAQEVQIWSFEGQDPQIVLGVRESGGRFRVFVAQGENAPEVVHALRKSLEDRQ